MKSIIRAVFSFLLSFLISIAILEFFVSSTFIAEKSNNDVYDDIGRGRRANFQYIKFGEGFSVGQFNEYRYMGPGYPYKKEPGTLRIALLGDSFVEGFQVFDRNHFRKLLEDELERKLNRDVEVLNFGRSGFDIADMYCYDVTFVSEFKPDLSLYFIANVDLIPVSTDPLVLTLNYENDSLYVSKQFPAGYIQAFKKTKLLIQHSSIISMLNSCRKIAASEGILPIILDKLYPTADKKRQGDHQFKIPRITTEIVNHMNTKEDIIVNRGFEYLDEKFVELINNKELLLINLNDTIQYMKEYGIDPNYWIATKKQGHWNQYGHKAVAKYITDRFLENDISIK